MRKDYRARKRLTAALTAGSIAIILNTLALKSADLVPLATARGGLLRLIKPWLARPLDALGVASLWATLGGPASNAAAFRTGFHLPLTATFSRTAVASQMQ